VRIGHQLELCRVGHSYANRKVAIMTEGGSGIGAAITPFLTTASDGISSITGHALVADGVFIAQ
jgi:hypothetical protein